MVSELNASTQVEAQARAMILTRRIISAPVRSRDLSQFRASVYARHAAPGQLQNRWIDKTPLSGCDQTGLSRLVMSTSKQFGIPDGLPANRKQSTLTRNVSKRVGNEDFNWPSCRLFGNVA